MRANLLLFCLAHIVSANEQYPYSKKYYQKNVNYFPFIDNSPVTVRDGLPIPLPKVWSTSNDMLVVRSNGFTFNATGNTCDDLEAAFDRYYKMMFDTITLGHSEDTLVSIY